MALLRNSMFDARRVRGVASFTRFGVSIILLLLPALAIGSGSWNGMSFSELNGVAQTAWNGTSISCAAAFDQEVADEAARLSLDPSTAVGWKVHQVDNDTIYQLNASSTAITGQFVSGAGTTEVNAVYSKRGTSGGKDYYNQLGQADDATTYSIVWGGLGILGTGWGINGSGAVLDYYSLDAVSRPDQVTTWISINDPAHDTGIVVTSVEAGELVAGLFYPDAFQVSGASNGRNSYARVLGGAAYEWDGTQWTSSSNGNGAEDTAFPWQAITGWSVQPIRDDVVAPENWSVWVP